MFIYLQQPLSDNESIAKQLYITCFEEDIEMAAPIMKTLSERGTTYKSVIRSFPMCTRDDYVKNVMDIIGSCRVAIIMLSKAMFNERNNILQQLLWYEVGCMLGCNVKIVLFFLDIPKNERNEYLKTTPVRQLQGTDNAEQLIQLLDSMQIEEKIFYEDPIINKYASRRITYVKLTSMFYIYKKDIDEIFNCVSQEDDAIDENEILDELLSELKCGCTVMSFNNISRLGPEVEEYYPEINSVIRDYPIKQNYSKPVLLNNKTSPDIYATVRTEFILPIHVLLGVTFKPFLSINKRSIFSPKHICRIINSNAASAENADATIYKGEKEQRVYFLFDIDTLPAEEKFEQYGKRLNHLWPQ